MPAIELETATVEADAMAVLRQRQEAALAALEEERAQLDALLGELAERVRTVTPGTEAADGFDREVAAAGDQLRSRIDDALRALHAPSELPAAAPADMATGEAALRWRRVAVFGSALQRMAQLRQESAARISAERRSDLLGITREGMRQLSREATNVKLMVRFHVARRRHSIDEVPQLARDAFTVGSALYRLLLTGAVLAVALWVRRRWRGWLDTARTTAFRFLDRITWKRRVQRLLTAIEVVAPWALFLLAIAGLRWSLGPASATTELAVGLTLLTVFGAYRLAIDILAAGLLGVAVHYGLGVSDTRRKMLLHSVRSVLRVGTVLFLILLLSRTMGQGYLSSLVVKFAWVIVLAAVLAELFRWRGVMVETFLELQSQGRLAAWVRATRSRWYGALVAPAAFLWLAGRGAAAVAREFALGFDQTQKALAYLFRLRIERQAEREGYAEGAVTELPAELVDAFQEDAVDRGPLVVANFPGLEDLHDTLSTWRDTGARGSFLLTGERGVGKTTWLNQIRREDLKLQRIVLGGRITEAPLLARRLAELLEVPPGEADSPQALARALNAGPRRVVILDVAQHLFLADVGGYDAFRAFAELVNRTCRHVFWLCSMNAHAWRHLRAVRADAAVFRGRQRLTGWSEDRIRELIRTRCAASGAQFNFADLAIDRIEGVSVNARLIESEEGYTRLLWDYSDGNPRAALHFFLRSLDPERGNRVRVRLFRAPDPDRLEEGGDDGLFVLAAIVTHESISLEHLVDVTRIERAQCFIHLDRLSELGALVVSNDLYRVSNTWHRAAVRLLHRRNLLPD